MSVSFQAKFKDKMRFMDKHGLKRTLQPQIGQGLSSNAFSTYTTNSNHKNKTNKTTSYNNNDHQSKNSYGTTGMSKNPKEIRRNVLGYGASHLLNNESPRKCKTIEVQYEKNPNNNKNGMSGLSNMQELDALDKERILLNSKSHSEQNYYEGLMNNKIYTHSMNDDMMTATNMSRNPEVEHLAIKLREKQREKFKQASAPKYIDQMLGKHEELLKMIDFKTKYKSTEPSSRQEREQNHISKIPSQKIILSKISLDSQREKKQENTPNYNSKGQKQIKLKKIEDIIARTKLNQLKQKQLQKLQPQQALQQQSPYLNTKYIKERKALYNKSNKLNVISHISDITPHTNSLPRRASTYHEADAQLYEADIPSSNGCKTYDATYNIDYDGKYERKNLQKYNVSHW